MTDSHALLCARDLSVGRSGQTVLRGIDLAIYPGEVWFFVGPNGSGKSTLLLTLLGLLPPIRGRVQRCPERTDPRHVSFVPQQEEWPDTLPTTACEFVELGLAGLGGSSRETRESARSALRVMGLEDLAGRDYRSLSGGQRQRVRVARALVRNLTLLVITHERLLARAYATHTARVEGETVRAGPATEIPADPTEISPGGPA